MKNPLPHVFIGSSKEGLEIARAVHSELEQASFPTIWEHDVFGPTKATLEQLENLRHSYDFAVLVMTPDDVRESRGRHSAIPRDNVVAELGLFIGSIGRSRTFFIKPRHQILDLPTDFLGITPLLYDDKRGDGNFRAAVSTACTQIRTAISQVSPRLLPDGSAGDVKFWHTVKDRETHEKDVRALIGAARQHVVITGICLHYIVLYCQQELRDALSHRVPVGLIISSATPKLINFCFVSRNCG